MKGKKTYLITGITGFIGSLIAGQLRNSSAYLQGKVSIIGIAKNKEKASALFADNSDGSIRMCDGMHIIEADIMDLDNCMEQIKKSGCTIDYIIHCASVTQSAYMVSNPVETADSIVFGTCNMLKIAKRFHIKSMVYLSSMEVYGQVRDIGRPRKEEELGDISLESSRSCYPMGKRMAEHYCCIYGKEYGVPVKIARLAQIFGQGVRPEDNRVYMQFARAAAEGHNIILRTQGLSMGNYCDSMDAVKAIFTILEKGADGEIYNVVNEQNTMCIKDMAELVARNIMGGKIQVKVEPEDAQITGYAPDTGLRLSGQKLVKLGWSPTKGLLEMYRDVICEITDW